MEELEWQQQAVEHGSRRSFFSRNEEDSPKSFDTFVRHTRYKQIPTSLYACSIMALWAVVLIAQSLSCSCTRFIVLLSFDSSACAALLWLCRYYGAAGRTQADPIASPQPSPPQFDMLQTAKKATTLV